MKDFSTKQGFLFYCFPLQEKEKQKVDELLALLDESGISGLLNKRPFNDTIGRPAYNPYQLFSAILFGFALGHPSLREIESSCRNDLRFIYILEGETPSYATVCTFINKVILPIREEIFGRITRTIFKRLNLEMRSCYIDGTKIEANANKYKFVWKPTKWHQNLNGKVRSLLTTMNLSSDLPSEGFIPASIVADKLSTAKRLDDGSKAWKGMTDNLTAYLLKIAEYEEKERICGPYRNSYYKTDHDATAMCLKQDYYSGLGSNMHAAYSIQLVACYGFATAYFVSQDRTDMYVLTRTIDRFYSMYGKYPERLVADAGYGCTENWKYCEDHGIKGFIKYANWSVERSGRRPALFELGTDDVFTCLGGKKGEICEIPGRHHKHKGDVFYKVEGCTGCAFMPYCRQNLKEAVGDSRIFEFSPQHQRYKQEARDRLLSVEGIEMRINRSIQSEGSFGVLKQDIGYTRFRRTSLRKAALEIMLTCLGHNVRKYLNFATGDKELCEWKVPEGTQPEKFKKPSSKRLANRANKKRNKSANETAKDSHSYKKTKSRAASKA